jgi:hypothetical protein
VSNRRRGEAGQVGGAEALAFGILVFVVGTLLVANAWGVIDAKLAASAAAREAARAFVEAASEPRAEDEAHQAARQAIEGHGRDPDRMALDHTGTFARCVRVTFEARYPVPTISLPWIGGIGGSVITARGRHSEVVDPYRSGLPGRADCGPA